ncbi:MAG TPA: indole-3-glycerol phosphate synthase TrpC [Ktedonobacterales bacterium]|nr:indole-3-glycerol phosphate synthase TrpC [Ktedonobacterales bacterium]
MAETFLERIVAATRAELTERQARVPLDELRTRAATAPAPRDFAAALRPEAGAPARLIAEIKRASPSKGLLAATFDPVAQARAYTAGGAAAISVLTEPRFFLGSLDHLTAVRAAVDIPVLRKDFILDEYQVYEARAAGADAVLLICALLDDTQLSDLLALARALGMEALVEAHDAGETHRAVASGASVIGVNSRDLRTFAVDTDVIRRLRPLVPYDRVFVAESGIADATGAARARAWDAHAILAGEALMRAPDPTAKAREFATAPGGATAGLFANAPHPFVKICGLTQPDHAALVADLRADAFGLVFAASKRRVIPDQARAIVAAAHTASPSPPRRSGGQGVRTPRAVGVFVNEPVDSIAAIARTVPLDAIQLSGDESPADCAAVARATHLPIIKALRPRTAADLALLDAYALAGATILLDTPSSSGAYGGTGQTGDWALARTAAARWPVILSGGLSPVNVADAIAAVHSRGVDVSSGVETDDVKDPDKIRAFIQAVCAAAESTESTSPTEASVSS